MKQIDYISAVEQMAFKGRTDVVIMVKNVDPIDYHTLFFVRAESSGDVLSSGRPGGQAIRGGGEKYPPPIKPAARRRQVDGGKIMALHKAGWPVAKIADEMRICQNTVRNYIRKMEEKENGTDHSCL